MQRTTINYATHSSNPIRARRQDGKIGWVCTKVSPGCQNCYAEALNRRFGTKQPYTTAGLEQMGFFLDEREFRRILLARPGKRIFIGDMLDLFLDKIPDEMLDRVFGAVVARPDLTFLILTKRPQRMQAYFSARREAIGEAAFQLCPAFDYDWPLPNLWVGVTIEDQQRADERIPPLLATPAAVRWVSCEPLLGPIDLGLLGTAPGTWQPVGNLLHWVVVGGESGPKARPMHPAWAESLRDQCQTAGASFWFKQWGEWLPAGQPGAGDEAIAACRKYHDFGNWVSARVGSNAAGRLLNGQEWNEVPDVS